MTYDAVNVKIRAMRGKLLTRDDYENLCRLASVENIGARLKEMPSYAKPLAELGGAPPNRKILEQKISMSLYDDYRRIHLFISGMAEKTFLSVLFLKYVLNFLKLLLCRVFDERDIPYSAREINMLLGWDARIDAARLAEARTIPAFLECLRGTDIYTVLADTYARQPTLFALERQIDLNYYLRLWKRLEKLPDKTNREVMARLKGTEIDLLNIMWLYRLRYYYKIQGAQVYANLIPINYKLKTADIQRMAECGGDGELLDIVAEGPYGHVFANFSKPERSFTREMRGLYDEEIKKHPNSLAAVAGYIFEKENEIDNITKTLEGVRYSLKPDDIMGYLLIS